ncbi:hypothetical protein GLOTRDRAFT_137591 [Gloeophyllum trabeum ATCC 11539]|uniref:Peptidase C14 caspase domain-containing protein n=1 Tax=Gloeophyllum trabeum (strain ATCC 11539 / FP-39264 / Madison 617) TaxID=670483 RepID=S7RVD4_GLOTA|nr:uncharacterized protein GLOTRDRAFT_137591 [Gloeophyllum trabeum ATCC 11539]EPQ57204.1 hypothetical protein GLOTRDRAFT_137591 [Gloeophyllum trabeum ATCC 11539]
MATRVFALVVGIDSYKSGNIWDLTSAVDDATAVKRWLKHDLGVPRDQVSFLINNKATKRNIEDQFTRHLLNNDAIEHGDAILIYFAGHGSTISGPLDWFSGKPGEVQVLCTFDHDTRGPEGRVAGISAVSLQAMLQELAEAKGNNITVMLDCCFAPTEHASRLRCTPTMKCRPHDLHTNMWRGLQGKLGIRADRDGFYQRRSSHILLAACGPRDRALEGKEGGRFTHSLLTVKDKVSLHRTTYAQLLGYINGFSREQRAVCVGKDQDRILFGGVPFVPESQFVAVDWDDDSKLRVGAGSEHGIVEGSELSFHEHNRRGSLNPPLTTLSVVEIHPTWSFARSRVPSRPLKDEGWARITRWNTRAPVYLQLKKALAGFFRRHEDLVIGTDSRRTESHVAGDRGTLDAMQQTSPVPALPKDGIGVADTAARFHLHLHRDNPNHPLRAFITIQLYRFDPQTGRRVSANLFAHGRAQMRHEENSFYQVVLRNDSEVDLWPYLASMRADGYGANMLFIPDHDNPAPPLRRHSQLVLGPSRICCDTSFRNSSKYSWDACLLKLFVSSKSVPVSLLEQGAAFAMAEAAKTPDDKEAVMAIERAAGEEIWDTVEGTISFSVSDQLDT